jgi:p-hydroxybenzoate 3-monooxygenase
MQWGRLFLCGDAAHIVPPTGAKGLNLAVSDIFYLSRALIAQYGDGNDDLLARYGQDALARVWQAMRFSWSLTKLMHRFPDQTDFDRRMQVAELAQLAASSDARRLFSQVYAGLPY